MAHPGEVKGVKFDPVYDPVWAYFRSKNCNCEQHSIKINIWVGFENAIPWTERSHFMMARAQFILDGHISCLKGFIPGQLTIEGVHPRFYGANRCPERAHLRLSGTHPRPERGVLLK